MKLVRIIKAVFSLLLSALFLASTGGLSIYEHYCKCTNTLEVAIDRPVYEGCIAGHEVSVPYKNIFWIESDCTHNETIHHSNEHHSHHCCTDKVILIKTDDFNPVKTTSIQQPNSEIINIGIVKLSDEVTQVCKLSLKQELFIDNKASGKSIILFTHQLRILSVPA